VTTLAQNRGREELIHGIILREEDTKSWARLRDRVTGHKIRGGECCRANAQQRFHHLKEIIPKGKFGQVPFDANLAASLCVPSLASEDEHQETDAVQRVIVPHSDSKIEPISIRHLGVDNCYDIVIHVHGGEHLPYDPTIRRVVAP
jgi:hypothetical protein